MLSLKHGANSLSLLLNSGILALTQSILRLVGECCLIKCSAVIVRTEAVNTCAHLWIEYIKVFNVSHFPGPSTDSSEEDLSLCAHGGSATVLEESRKETAPAPLPASGPELAAMMKIGTRVMRGVDWKWGDQVPESILQSFWQLMGYCFVRLKLSEKAYCSVCDPLHALCRTVQHQVLAGLLESWARMVGSGSSGIQAAPTPTGWAKRASMTLNWQSHHQPPSLPPRTRTQRMTRVSSQHCFSANQVQAKCEVQAMTSTISYLSQKVS